MGISSCPWRKEGIVVSYETEHFAEGFGNDNAARGYGVVNCESTLEEGSSRRNDTTHCAESIGMQILRIQMLCKIIACYLNGKTLESTAKELHLTVRAVHYRVGSNAEVYKRTSEYILRFLMWHYFRFRCIICLCVALHLASRQREKIFFAEILEIA